MIKILTLTLICVCILGLIPQPKSMVLSNENLELTRLPTIVGQNLPFDTEYYFDKLVERKINHLKGKTIGKEIQIIVSKRQLEKQQYILVIQQQGIKLEVGSYSGYVYGLETLFQLINDSNKIPTGIIKDNPILPYRGIMVDTVRHFISVPSLKRILNAMALTKLNIFHWHLFDNEAFPFQSSTNPELQSAAYTKKLTYSRDQIQDLIKFAQLNAIQIIPQIQSPAHVRSWGQNNIWEKQKLILNCGGISGQVDVSKQKAYQLFTNVTFQLDSLFRKSDYIHLGGKDLNQTCWKNSPSINMFMTLHNFKSVQQLQLYWQKQLRKNIAVSKKAIYWRNKAPELTLEDEVIIQYNGHQDDINSLAAKTKNKLILSPANILDLSSARGNYKGDPEGNKYVTALQIYQNFAVFPNGVDPTRILGGQVTLWTDISNEATLDNDLWIRSAAFAQRVWSNNKTSKSSFVKRMVQLTEHLQAISITPSPFVSQYCQTNPDVCFGSSELPERFQFLSE